MCYRFMQLSEACRGVMDWTCDNVLIVRGAAGVWVA